MVSFRPLKDRVVGPLPHGRTPWLLNRGDPNHLLIRMILQAGPRFLDHVANQIIPQCKLSRWFQFFYVHP